MKLKKRDHFSVCKVTWRRQRLPTSSNRSGNTIVADSEKFGCLTALIGIGKLCIAVAQAAAFSFGRILSAALQS